MFYKQQIWIIKSNIYNWQDNKMIIIMNVCQIKNPKIQIFVEKFKFRLPKSMLMICYDLNEINMKANHHLDYYIHDFIIKNVIRSFFFFDRRLILIYKCHHVHVHSFAVMLFDFKTLFFHFFFSLSHFILVSHFIVDWNKFFKLLKKKIVKLIIFILIA